MLHYDENMICFGPGDNNLDNYLFNHQASILFQQLYSIFSIRDFSEDDYGFIFGKAIDCCCLIYLDTHPDLHSEDYFLFCEKEFYIDKCSCTDKDKSLRVIFAAKLTLYVLLQCKKTRTLVVDLFLKKLSTNMEFDMAFIDLDKTRYDAVLDLVEKVKKEGGVTLDFNLYSATSFLDRKDIDTVTFTGFDDPAYFWTEEDCKRFIRMGRTPEDQQFLYNEIKKAAARSYQTACETGDTGLIYAFENSFIHINVSYDSASDALTKKKAKIYFEEFELPEFYTFQSFETLGAVDSKEADMSKVDSVNMSENVELKRCLKEAREEIEILKKDKTKQDKNISGNSYEFDINDMKYSLKPTQKNKLYLLCSITKKALSNDSLTVEEYRMLEYITGISAKTIETTYNKASGDSDGHLSYEEKRAFESLASKYGL